MEVQNTLPFGAAIWSELRDVRCEQYKEEKCLHTNGFGTRIFDYHSLLLGHHFYSTSPCSRTLCYAIISIETLTSWKCLFKTLVNVKLNSPVKVIVYFRSNWGTYAKAKYHWLFVSHVYRHITCVTFRLILFAHFISIHGVIVWSCVCLRATWLAGMNSERTNGWFPTRWSFLYPSSTGFCLSAWCVMR